MKKEDFLAYEIRGRDITTHDAFLLGRSLGSHFSGSCFVAWDCRGSSPQLGQHLIEGLRSSGISVTSGGLMPNPACYYNTFNKHDFGVFITGSHNPPEYNGFKMIMRDGSSISVKDFKEVKKRFLGYKFNRAEAVPVKQDITALNKYINFLKKEFKALDIKCVIDCFNATTSLVAGSVFKALLDAKVINDEPLPDFGGKHPEPTEKNLKQAQAEVVKTKAAFGVGLDGDGDRSVFIDEKGEVIDGNKMTMLFAKHVLSKEKGVIVAPVSVSKLLESEIVNPLGGKMIWCPVGHTFIEKELVKHNGLFAGEYSSHFFFNEYYPFSDGILSILMLARILKQSGKKLSELVGELPNVFVVKEEIEFDTHKQKEKVAKALAKRFIKEYPKALTMDGIKFVQDDVCVLLRQSNTRHTVKAFIEAEDKTLANKKLREYVKIIESYTNS